MRKLNEEQKMVVWGCIQALSYVAVLAAFLAFLAWREGSFRRRVMEADPSGTALRVCDEVEAQMQQERLGRVCVAVTKALRRMGGEK